jgi:hypothetical protein
MSSAEICAALAAVIAHEETPALAELRAALAESQRAAAEASGQHAAELAAMRARYQRLMNDAVDLAELARGAGVDDGLVEAYAPPRCLLCGAADTEVDPWILCAACLAPLRARGWREIEGDAPDCACGEIADGWVGGRARCVPCARRFVERRGRRR